MKRLVTALSLLALGALAQTWNMATPYPPANFHTQNILQFVKEVEEATGGRLKITVHPGGSLFPHPQILPAVRNGQVQMGEVFMSLLANENPSSTWTPSPSWSRGTRTLGGSTRPSGRRWRSGSPKGAWSSSTPCPGPPRGFTPRSP